MMNIIEKQSVRMLILDDRFGRINSHWPFSTTKLKIISRIYYDEVGYEQKVEEALKMTDIDIFGFSGRGAVAVVERLTEYLSVSAKEIVARYISIPKIMKLHNTNLSEQYCKDDIAELREMKKKVNDWAKIAFNHPFNILLVQTCDDAEIINAVRGSDKAIWAPYAYNDQLFYDRQLTREVDIGVYCKLSRHDHRIEFVEKLEMLAKRKGYCFEFSDQYWGEEYARKISQAKVVVHLSYCGDIPWRLYECAASGTCFLTDPLRFKVERLFSKSCYVEYNRDFSNLELMLDFFLGNKSRRENVVRIAQREVQKYAWSQYADNWLMPRINRLLSSNDV